MRLYSGPRVLWPDGTSVEIEVRAGYSDKPFCFNSSVGGISFPENEREIAKFVACYLRSGLAKYWMILNGYSATAERARVSLGEIMSLPFIHPDEHPKPDVAKHALSIASEKIAQYEAMVGTAFAEAEFDVVHEAIDEIVFDYFSLSRRERVLVTDMITLAAKSLQPTSYEELFTPLQDDIDASIVRSYLEELLKTLAVWSNSRGGSGSIAVRCLNRTSVKTPLDVVHVHLNAASAEIKANTADTSQSIISLIQKRLADDHPLNFFAMPNSTFVLGDDIYIIKPARVRFWTQSAALRDADDIVSLVASSSGSKLH